MELFQPYENWQKSLEILDPEFWDPDRIFGIFSRKFGKVRDRIESDVKGERESDEPQQK